jgi:hypothetical protein
MTDLRRILGVVTLGLALVTAAGPAMADEGNDGRGDGGFRDGGVNLGGFYRGPDSRAHSGAGSNYGLGRQSTYGRPVSPFPCPYPSLYIVPSGGWEAR